MGRFVIVAAGLALAWAAGVFFAGGADFALPRHAPANDAAAALAAIKLPPGFHIDMYADNVPGARSMTLGPNGTLFVGTRETGRVYALQDLNRDNRADRVITIAEGLDEPNGVAFRQGALYIAEVSRVTRYDNIEANLDRPSAPVIVNDTFPKNHWHGWKFIAFGPDDMLYVPVGAPFNAGELPAPIYATVTRMKPDGTRRQIFASGIRNTVGFDWDPLTKELWFTDNGRDYMGDNLPPDELNCAPKPGLNFGFPYWCGKNTPDSTFGVGHKASDFTPPVMELGPHVAALGMRFYMGKMFPPEYQHAIFIAEHGSWNRSIPIGYRVTVVRIEDNQGLTYEPFAEGWLQLRGKLPGYNVSGRPVDVQVMPDGALLVSDDYAGAIYRISYAK